MLHGRHVDPDRYDTRNLVQRIANLLREAGNGELTPTPWQLSQVRLAEGERTRG